MPTNEARKVDSWDEEVTDVAPKQVDSWDEEVVDEPVKKKVTPSPSQTQSSSNGLNLLSGVIPSGKALLTGQKEESVPTEQKQIDLTNAPIAEDESTRTDKFIRKPIDKKKVDEIYTLSKQNESLVDEFSKSHFVLDNLSQTEAIKQLNDLYAKREQAKDPQTAQAIDNQIEVIKSQPVEKQPSIQEAVLQNAQKYGSQPQDFNRPEIPMNPLTPNQILERNGMKTANTVGELHDRYIESATKLNELRPELDKTATELDTFKKDARTADFKTDKSGNKTLEGLADIPEAFGHGFGGTMKSIEQGFVNLLGDKQDRIDYAKKRYLEDNILYPTRTKGMATSGAEMIGGVAPYVISTAVLPQTALLGHVIINGLTMGASGYGNGYYEMFAKQKQQGVSDEEADAIAMQNAKFEGAKETAIGASLPFMGGAGSKLFLAPAEKSAMKQFLATQGVIIPTFTAGKLASNVYQKYGLGEKDVNLGDGLAETAENGLILGAMMEFAHKAPPKLKELYRANLSEQYPSIQQSVDKAVKDGVMDASQGYAFTEKLKRDFAVFNAMPKDITTEQKLAIEPEVKQIIELSSREPSAVESPEVTKDKIVQLQKQVAEKLGTPLTEKEMKSYEKLQEIKGDKEDKLTPSEKLELKHYEKRIKTAEDNDVKLAEEKKVAEAETPTNVGVEEGSVGVGGDVGATTKALEEVAKKKPNASITFINKQGYEQKVNLNDTYEFTQPEEAGLKGETIKGFRNQNNTGIIPFSEVAEAYHKAKKDGSNPELVKAVEQSLKETTKEGSVGVGGDVWEYGNDPLESEIKRIEDNLSKGFLVEISKKSLEQAQKNPVAFLEDYRKQWANKKPNEAWRQEELDAIVRDIDKKIKQLQSLKETTKAETPTETIQEKGIEEAGSVGGGRDKSDADIEKRMAELEGAKIGTPELAEFNALEKEMEKRERDTVFNVPLENVNDAVDTLMKKEKEQPNGYGSFIEKRDARETKEVADRYLNAKDLTDAELKQDFSDAVRGNPTTWYADGLKMREALKEATNRGIDTRDMLAEVTKVYEDAGYDTETAKSVVAGMIKPILVKSQKMDKSATTETGKSGSGDIEIAKRVNNLGEFDNEIRGVTNQRRIPNEIKERYIEALRTLAINKEIGIDHPQAKRYESVYDILDANEKKKEPNKKFNKEDTFSEKSKSYFTPHELIPNVGESFDDAQKRAEKHFGMKSPYPIELIKEAKEIFSGFSYASEGFNDYVYERMQESTKKTTEPSLSQKENKLVTEEIKTAIDNGEITREQVDGFTEQDESAIEDIERKAESENEAELNSAIDQADKLIGEAVGATEGEKQPTDKGTSEDKVTGIKKAMVEKDRADAGLPPIELPKSNKPQEQLERAKELVDSGEVDPSELEAYLISHAENPSDAKTSEADQYILQYQRMKIEARSKEILTERMAIEDRLKEDPTDVQANLDLASNEIARQQNIYDLDRNTTASRVTSSIWGKLGNAKQQVINERGIVQEQINRIKELHGKDVPKEVQDKLDSLEKKNTELTARIEAIEKNITEQIAQGQLNKESRKPLIRRTSRRSDEEINAQIKDKLSTIANKIAERIEKSAVKNFAANKEQSKSLIADIAPDVMDVVKLVSEKTGNKLEDVVNKTYDAIKDIAEGIGKRDIVDIIAGKYSDKKPLSELQKQINEIRNQAKLTIRLEEIENNIERETKARGEASPEVKALRKEISELQSQEGLRKRIEDVKNGVEKKVKEKGEQSEEVKALRKELSDLESQDRLKKRIEDLQNGVLRETKARGEASPEVQKLKKQADELNKKNKKELANFSANELKKQAEQLQKKIDKGEFLPQKTVKKVFEQDANWVKYSQEKKKLKQELNHLEAQALYDKKNLYMKTLDQFNKFSRLGLFIFSTAYQLKLAAAALSTIAHKPIEDLVGTAIKPMVKEIADRAPIEGRNINAEATAEFYKNLSPIKILRGAYQILSKGESDLSRELSSHPKKEGNIFNPLSDHSALNWIADDPHKIIKNPIKQGIFDASLANYMNYYASKGMDINDPVLIEKARQASYMRAEYEIFMGGENSKTAVSEWFKKMESEGILDAQSESFKTKVGGNLKYSISALKNFIVPIASVPANILNRTVKNNPISTAYRFSEALKTNSELKNNVTETLDNLTEAQADLMLRDLKKGAIGSVYWTLGFIMAGNALGGFFNKSYPDKKRDKDEKGHDEMEIFGKNIPHGVQHAVPLQQMQMAATFALTLKYFNEQDKKKLKDDFGLKDEIKNVGAGGAEIARTYINEHPMSKASLDIVKALEGGKGREKYFNSLERRSDIPQTKFLLQDIGLIEKDDSYEKQKAKSKKHKEVKDLYDVFWYMMDDKKFENHNE